MFTYFVIGDRKTLFEKIIRVLPEWSLWSALQLVASKLSEKVPSCDKGLTMNILASVNKKPSRKTLLGSKRQAGNYFFATWETGN